MKKRINLKKKACILFFSVLFQGEIYAKQDVRIGLVIGTRPEAIKVIPVYLELKNRKIDADIIFTGQHKEMVSDIFDIFDVKSDYNFDVMKSGQDLSYLNEIILNKTKALLREQKFSCILVQGDTTSAYASALGSFYSGVPVVHLEAGLRSHNIQRPFPEEAYRQMISRISTLHLAPTNDSKKNLINEAINPDKIFVVGNTVVDALRIMREKINQGKIIPSTDVSDFIKNARSLKKKVILLTAHRRESIPDGILNIFQSIQKLLLDNEGLSVIYPMHPNPKIKEVYDQVFISKPQDLYLCPPLIYQDLTYVLQNVDWVLTDSGGIQEEAVSLGKPTLVLREETDRPEAIQENKAILVGTDSVAINQGINWLLNLQLDSLNSETSIYGDGYAAQKSVDAILNFINSQGEDN